MFKTLLILMSALSVNAATIFARATCNGQVSSTSCVNIGDPIYSAQAQVVPMLYVSAIAYTENGTASAYAFFQETFSLTVTGGTGGGFITPCLFAGAHGFMGSATAALFVGGTTIPFTDCPSTPEIPFTYGVPQEFTLSLEASIASFGSNGTGHGGGAEAGVPQGPNYALFKFWDANGNPLSNVNYTVVDLALPEPGSFAVCGLVLLCGFVTTKLTRRHLFG